MPVLKPIKIMNTRPFLLERAKYFLFVCCNSLVNNYSTALYLVNRSVFITHLILILDGGRNKLKKKQYVYECIFEVQPRWGKNKYGYHCGYFHHKKVLRWIMQPKHIPFLFMKRCHRKFFPFGSTPIAWIAISGCTYSYPNLFQHVIK